MRKPQGYGHVWDRESGKTTAEHDTFTCAHCNKVTRVKPFCDPADLGGHCCVCDSLICKNCHYLMSMGKPCVPFVERINRLDTHFERGGGMEAYDAILDNLDDQRMRRR